MEDGVSFYAHEVIWATIPRALSACTAPFHGEGVLLLYRFWCQIFVNILRILTFQCQTKGLSKSKYIQKNISPPSSDRIHIYRPYPLEYPNTRNLRYRYGVESYETRPMKLADYEGKV